MTVQEMISLVRSGLKEIGRLRYKTGTATGGAADGSTMTHSIGGVVDAWNETEVRLTSGNNNGLRREVGDSSSGTITFVEPFPFQIDNGVTFELGEKGFISDHQIIEWFTLSQDTIIVVVVPDAFPGHTTILEVGATGGVSNALPANLAGPPRSLQFRDTTTGNEYDVTILPPTEKDRFREDAYLGGDLEDMVAIFENGKISYRPTDNGLLLLPVVPKFDAVTFTGGSKLPSYLHQLQVKYAIWQGWDSKQRADFAARHEKAFFDLVNAINAQYQNVSKQIKVEE